MRSAQALIADVIRQALRTWVLHPRLLAEACAMPTGERIWQQPIETSYFEKNVKSSIADLKNYPGSSEKSSVAQRLWIAFARVPLTDAASISRCNSMCIASAFAPSTDAAIHQRRRSTDCNSAGHTCNPSFVLT